MGSCRKCIQVGSFQCDNGRAFLCSVVTLVYQISVHLNSGKLGEVSVTPDGDITITIRRPTTVCSINNLIGVIRCLAFLFKGNFYGVISIHITKGVACGCCHFRTIHLYVRNIISFVRLDCICKLTCGRYRCRATGRDCSTDTCRCGNLVACCTARRRYRRCIRRKTPTSTEYHGCAV